MHDAAGCEDELEGEGEGHAPVSLPWCKEAYVRIMVQAMRELGYRRSAESLELEAGMPYSASFLVFFSSHV